MGPMGPMLPPDLGPGAVAPWPRGPVAPSLVELRGREASSLKRKRFDSDSGGQHPAICEVVLTFETREVNKVKKFR